MLPSSSRNTYKNALVKSNADNPSHENSSGRAWY